MTPVQLSAGFADPVGDSQSVFRTLVQAMARPGTIGRTPVRVEAPAPLGPGMAALVLALCDGATPVWLDARLGTGPVAGFIRFHTGAPVVTDPAEAAFALVADPADLPAIDSFALGALHYPDRSTTLVLAAEALETAKGWRLNGPGIEGETLLDPTPTRARHRVRGRRPYRGAAPHRSGAR